MNHFTNSFFSRISLLLLLWITLGSSSLYAQTKEERLNFSIQNASLDTFVKQLEASTGFSIIYGENIHLKKPVTLNMSRKSVSEILRKAFCYRNGKHLPIKNTRSAVTLRTAFHPRHSSVPTYSNDTRGQEPPPILSDFTASHYRQGQRNSLSLISDTNSRHAGSDWRKIHY